MAINRGYCRTDGVSLTYAPTWVELDGCVIINPSEEQYRAAGWMLNAVTPPEPREGMMVAATRYEIACEAGLYSVVAVYEYAPVPVPPKRYSKKKFSLALAKRGIFQAFDAWADATEVIPGSGLTVKRVLADSWYMSDEDDEFKAVRSVAEAQFGADKIAEVLAESEDEEW